MDQDHDFSALRNLLALKKLDMPQDTQIDEFLVEFHRRQRSALLVKQSVWSRSAGWIKERVAGIQLIPSLSYAGAVAAIAITAVVGLSQQVQVTQVDGQNKLTLRMPTHNDTSFAMVPGSFVAAPSLSSKSNVTAAFTPVKADSATTRYVLATSTSHAANDATVAF
jgi:hypothetical protein